MDPNFPYGACLIDGVQDDCPDMKSACSAGDLILGNNKCFSWLQTGNSSAKDLAREYCTKNYTDSRCAGWLVTNTDEAVGDVARAINATICQTSDDIRNKMFCRSLQATKFGGFDNAAAEYCTKYDDPLFCACDTGWKIGLAGGDSLATAFRPCLFADCKDSGYHSEIARNVERKCPPSLQLCTMGANIRNATDTNIKQECNFGGSGDGLPVVIDDSEDPEGKYKMSTNTKILAVLFIFIIVITLMTVSTNGMGKKAPPGNLSAGNIYQNGRW